MLFRGLPIHQKTVLTVHIFNRGILIPHHNPTMLPTDGHIGQTQRAILPSPDQGFPLGQVKKQMLVVGLTEKLLLRKLDDDFGHDAIFYTIRPCEYTPSAITE